MAIDFEERTEAFERKVVDFQNKTVLPWYDEVATLDGAAVRARGNAINTQWEKLVAAHAGVAAEGAAEKRQLATPAPAAAPAAHPTGETVAAPREVPTATIKDVETGIVNAAASLERARKHIGLVVGLQDFRGVPTLRGYKVAETGKDPTVFVDTQVERALHAFSIVLRAGALVEKQAGFPTEREQEQLVDVIASTTSEIEYKFVMAALTHLGYGDEIYSMRDDPKARMVAHHEHLQELDAATQGGGIDPRLAEGMSKDADILASEANASVTNNATVDAVLARYAQPPEVKRVFVRLLERRNIVDALIIGGDTAKVAKYFGREADAKSFVDTSALGAVKEVGEEAGRQTPGALCSFVAGVYGGLGDLPIVGGLAKDASAGWKSLAKEADKAMGAWEDGAKTRDTVAFWTGFVFEKGIEIALTKKLAAGRASEAMHVIETTDDAIDTLGKANAYVQRARMLYEEASGAYKFAIKSLPSVLSTVREGIALGQSGDDMLCSLGIDLASTGFDMGLAALEKKCKASFTAEGRVEKAESEASKKKPGPEIEEDALPAPVRDALKRMRAAERAVATSKDRADAAKASFDVKDAADDLRVAIKAHQDEVGLEQLRAEEEDKEKRKDKVKEARGGIPGEIKDRLVTMFLTAGTSIVKEMKKVFVDHAQKALLPGPDGKRTGIDAVKLKKELVAGAAVAGAKAVTDTLIGDIRELFADALTEAIATDIDAHYPGTRDEAERHLREPMKKLLEYVTNDLPEDWLKERVEDAIAGLFE